MKWKENSQMELPQEWPGVHYYDRQELEAVTRVVKSGSPFRFYGPDHQREVDGFENEFASYIGTRYCLAVSSGTAALQVALAAMGVGPGDEVLLPGYFWVSTVSAVVRSGAIPGLVDVDRSFSMDPEDLVKKISERTRAVIMVHMGGVMGKVARVRDICHKHGLLLLEDCAQAGGASQFGKKAGSFGDMAIFSFQLNKNFTSGEGGAIVTDSEEFYNKAFAVHDLGYSRRADGRLEFDDPEYQRWGIGCRMTEMVGALLRVQLGKLDSILASMRATKYELIDLLSGYKGISTRSVEDPAGDSGGFLKISFDEPSISRKFFEKLQEEGIRVREGGMNPVHMTEWGLHIYFNVTSLVNKTSICGHHPVWELEENSWGADYEYGKGTLPVLDSFVGRTVIFCIPSLLTGEMKRFISDAFRQSCEKLGFTKAT